MGHRVHRVVTNNKLLLGPGWCLTAVGADMQNSRGSDPTVSNSHSHSDLRTMPACTLLRPAPPQCREADRAAGVPSDKSDGL